MSIILDVECIACNKTLQKISHNPREASQKMGKITHSNRRSRTPNWSLEEKQYLLELIKERKEVVVTKSNNGPNHSEEKDVAWNDILYQLAVKFGSKFSGFSIKKVKTQWQNMKRIAREEIILNGASLAKCTKQSQEVCNILESQNAADIKQAMESMDKSDKLIETTVYTDVEIKSETIDEDINQPCGSSSCPINNQQNKSLGSLTLESSASSASMPSENIDTDIPDEVINIPENDNFTRDVSTETDVPGLNDFNNISTFEREFANFLKYSAAEKEIKMESLKEERQVVRAMRETAELNKIIAEQRLKHILWIKKQEMAMYSGEPGSGAGKGGGGGGAIREAGGAFGKMEAAREDEYFYKKQKEQLQNIKGHLDKEISFHQEQIKRHEDAIRRHKEQMSQMAEK